MGSKNLLSNDLNFDENKIINLLLFSIMTIMPFIVLGNYKQSYINGKVIWLYFSFLTIFIFFVMKKSKLSFRIEEVLISIFLLSLVVSSIFSIDVITSLIGKTGRYEGLFMYCVYIGLFLISSRCINISKFSTNTLGLFGTVMAIYTLLQFYEKNPFSNYQNMYRAYGTIGNNNFAGTYFLLFLILMLSIYVIYGGKIYFTYSLVIFSGLMATLTRGCWIALIIVAILALIEFREYKKRIHRCIIVIIGFTSIFISMNISSDNILIDRSKLVVEDVLDMGENSGSGRVAIWRMVIKSIKKNPIVGSGLDTLDSRLASDVPELFWDISSINGAIDKAHNELLEYWACGGIITVISYIILVSVILYKLFKNKKNNISKIYMFIIVGYLVQSMFNISVVAVAPIYWIILGAAVKHYRELDKDKLEQKPIKEEVQTLV